MKKASAFVAVAILSFASVGAAQQYYIRPTESKRDLERRIWQLERAVQELQNKVYQLESAPPPPATNEKAWHCKATAFTATFAAFGPTRLEASEKSMEACRQAGNADMHCRATCTENK